MSFVEQVESSDGTAIAYRAVGDGDPLVLVHGGCTSSGDWAAVVPLLKERFTVVTIDRRGRGRSEDGPEYALEREADDVLAVLDRFDAKLLVGHSYGALCSILAAERSDRLRRLVLYEPPIAVEDDEAGPLEEMLAAGEEERALERFLRAVGVADEQIDEIRDSPGWPVLLGALPVLPRELRACRAWRNPQGPIDVAALFLFGGETTSAIYTQGLDELRAAFPESRLERIPGQRHVAHVFAPEEFARIVTRFCANG